MTPQLAPRRRGRPSLSPGEKTVALTVNVPASQYDALAREALTKRIGLARLIRERLFFQRIIASHLGTGAS